MVVGSRGYEERGGEFSVERKGGKFSRGITRGQDE